MPIRDNWFQPGETTNMPVAGYVGYTVEQKLQLFTCTANLTNPLFPPALVARIAQQKTLPIFAGGMSGWSFVLNYNNHNGMKPIPAGHSVVGKIEDSYNKIIPCNSPVQNRSYSYYEKFFEIPPPAGAPLGTPGKIRDVQAFTVACKCVYCYTRIASTAILPTPFAAEIPAPPNENTARLDFRTLLNNTPAADKAALQGRISQFERAFSAALTLKITLSWFYDNCASPPNTPCGKIHCFEFTAETFDPDNGGARTFITPNAPLGSQSDP